MNDKDRNNVQKLIAVYERRVSDLQVKISYLTIPAAKIYKQSLKDNKEFLADLNSLVSPKPSRFEIRAHNNFEEE